MMALGLEDRTPILDIPYLTYCGLWGLCKSGDFHVEEGEDNHGESMSSTLFADNIRTGITHLSPG